MDGNHSDSGLCSTLHVPQEKGKSPGQICFGRCMILPINHVADWRYMRQRKQVKIDKDVIREKTTRIDHNYRVGYKVMTKTKSVYKYETLFKVPHEIFHTWTNRTVTLRTVAVTKRINIRNIKPYNNTILEGRDPLKEV